MKQFKVTIHIDNGIILYRIISAASTEQLNTKMDEIRLVLAELTISYIGAVVIDDTILNNFLNV